MKEQLEGTSGFVVSAGTVGHMTTLKMFVNTAF